MNKIGTIRDQYEWQPKGNSDGWLIEEEKMSKVQPLVDFINHAGELKSTKVMILFDLYYIDFRYFYPANVSNYQQSISLCIYL